MASLLRHTARFSTCRTACTLAALQDFFDSANARGLFLGMTFDRDNWHWTGECPLQAAAALTSQVRYVHCKGVQRQQTEQLRGVAASMPNRPPASFQTTASEPLHD